MRALLLVHYVELLLHYFRTSSTFLPAVMHVFQLVSWRNQGFMVAPGGTVGLGHAIMPCRTVMGPWFITVLNTTARYLIRKV